MPIVEGTEAWETLAQQTRVDLSQPASQAVVALSVLPQPGPGAHEVVLLTGPVASLIALCQQALGEVLSAMMQSHRPVPITGQYDCDSAQAMVAIADLVGQDTSGVTVWPLGLRELVYLLGSSRTLQQMVRDAKPTKSGGAIALQPGLFAPAMPPVGCAVSIGTTGTSGGAAVVAYGDQPDAVSGNGPSKTGGWLLPVGIGIALGAIGAAVYAGSTQRRGQHG
jgi:hypothetical protein